MALEELASILFQGSETRDDTATTTQIIYGVAVSDSANGEVQVQLDAPILSEQDEDLDSYTYLTLGGEDDDVNAISEEDEEEDEEFDTVYWESADDDAVEEDS